MSWLVVTPARNEAERLPTLAASLARQQPGMIGYWIVVDDGSTDATASCLPEDLPFPSVVITRSNDGGLAKGSAFGAWLFGVEHGLRLLPEAERVMKLDADVVLADDHLGRLSERDQDAGLVSGVLTGAGEVHRSDYTRGPLKAYSRRGLEVVRQLPTAVGFDVMDEVALRRAGLRVLVVPEATAELSRLTGSSEGLLRGRWRGGRVARWTGYHPGYLALRLVRYLWRRPYVIGSLATAAGWLSAGPGPYPLELRRELRREQSARLRQLVRRPRTTLRSYRAP